MNKEEMICKNCKYHYIEDISFDYPQSCCYKRQCTTEQWCKCYDFEYSDRYVEQLQQENNKLKDDWNKLKKYIKTEIPEDAFIDTEWFVSILDKMQELEQGSDSNE